MEKKTATNNGILPTANKHGIFFILLFTSQRDDASRYLFLLDLPLKKWTHS